MPTSLESAARQGSPPRSASRRRAASRAGRAWLRPIPRPRRVRAALAALVLVAPAGAGGVESDFVVPDGLAVTLFAESPLLFNPTAIDVDARGRLWVAEAVNYRKWDGRNPGREHPQGDRIVVLEDTDGDGAADRSTVFAQDADLVAPLGIAVLPDRVLVSCSPHALAYFDDDGDLVADRRQTFLTGFGGHDHDHGLHSFTVGPDGRLVFAVGNAGPHLVTDAGGWTLRSGSAYTGGGEHVAPNVPGLLSDGGRAWTGGLVLAVERDGTGLSVLGHNFRNEYEAAVDAFGDVWTADNDDDGHAACRTLWVMPGGDHGYMSADGTRFWGADRRPGQDTPTAHWHQDDPGVVPAGTINGAGGPTGVAIYEHGVLAPWLDGLVLNCDAGAGVVYGHRPRLDGAGFLLERTEVVAPAPGADGERVAWFRPSDVAIGTDGCLYVADWYDPGVGGHAAGDREAYGRILRIVPRGQDPRPPAIDITTPAGRAAAITSPAVHVRALGRSAIAALGEAGHAEVDALLASADPRVRARGVWLLAEDRGRFLRRHGALASEDPDPRVRVAAVRAFERAFPGARGLSAVPFGAPPPVRRELALALAGDPLEVRLGALAILAAAYEGGDRVLLEALGIAARGLEAELYEALAAALDAAAAPAEWPPGFAELAWRLHPPAAREGLLARALDETLPPLDRRRAVDALAFMPEREAAEAVLTLALGGPDDVRDLARSWIEHRDGNEWRAHDLAGQIAPSGLARAERVFASDVVRAGLLDVDVDVTGAERLWLVVTDGGDGNACDWADWVEPRLLGDGWERALAQTPWESAQAQWGDVRAGESCAGGALRVGGEDLSGIGTHARSEIAFALPDGSRRFVARAGPDDGGTSQAQGTTSIAFEVWIERPARRALLVEAEGTLLDEGAGEDARLDAAARLAGDAEGGLVLLDLVANDRLPDVVRADVAEAIFGNPDPAVRALASAAFPRTGSGGIALPPLEALAAMPGHPDRGARVFTSATAQCSTCHAVRGLGGAIGPELTTIRGKLAAPALLDAILNPSAAIAHGYDAYAFTLDDGRRLSGFLLADGARVLVKDTLGQRHVLERDAIVARRKHDVSTMPEGLALGLSAQDLADLRAFLLEDTDAPPVLGDEIVLFDGTDLRAWTHHLAEPGADPASTWSIRDGVLACTGTPVGYLRTKDVFEHFVLTLEWRFDPVRGAGNSGVLLRTAGEDRVWPKSIEAQLNAGDAGDIWNIGEVGLVVDRARTEGRRTRKLRPSSERPLGEWNRYEITVHGGRVRLVVNGVLQNEATWADVQPGAIALQSEGAAIEFRDVRLRPIVR